MTTEIHFPHLTEAEAFEYLTFGSLDRADGASIRAHVRECAPCARRLESERLLEGALKASHTIRPSHGFSSRVVGAAKLVQSPHRTPAPPLFAGYWGVVLILIGLTIGIRVLAPQDLSATSPGPVANLLDRFSTITLHMSTSSELRSFSLIGLVLLVLWLVDRTFRKVLRHG